MGRLVTRKLPITSKGNRMKRFLHKTFVACVTVSCAATMAPVWAQAQVPRTPAAATAGAPATQAQRMFGDIAPKFAELTDKVLFGDVWERPGLSKRDRSLVTVSALVAMNRPDQLRSHLQRARDNGLSESELVEAITHLAFYSGWPNAVTAIAIAREVFQKK
jgi:4-carboxymuconolactone decarboxylase